MTISLPEARQSPVLVQSQPVRLARWALMLGALGLLGGAGYAAGRLTNSGSTPPPAREHGAAAPAAQTPQAEPRAAAAVAAPQQASQNGSDDGEDTSSASDRAVTDTAPAPSIATANAPVFYVQVASYKSDSDAKDYAANLTARGLKVDSTQDPESPSWHLVRLGPFETRGQAEKTRFLLKLNERMKAYVTPRSNGKYHVQVGSFASLKEAEGVAKSFSALGHVTKISRIKMGDRRWHCVRIGPFDTPEEAGDYRELVKGMSSDSVVIPYGPPKA